MLVPALVTALVLVLGSLVYCWCAARKLRRELADSHAREQQHKIEAQQQAAAEAIISRAHDETSSVPEQRHHIRYSRAQGHVRPVRNISIAIAACFAGLGAALKERATPAAALAAATGVTVAVGVAILTPDDEDNYTAPREDPPLHLPADTSPSFTMPPAEMRPASAPGQDAAPDTTVPNAPPTSTTDTPPPPETTTETETHTPPPETITEPPPPDGDGDKSGPRRRDDRCITPDRAPICVDLRHLDRLRDKITEDVVD